MIKSDFFFAYLFSLTLLFIPIYQINGLIVADVLESTENHFPDIAPTGLYITWQKTSSSDGSYSIVWIKDQNYQFNNLWINDLKVFNDTIYSCGSYIVHDTINHVDHQHYFYMIGNNRIELPKKGDPAEASRIWVDNGNVYVVGQDSARPCYWINAEKHILPCSAEGGGATDICVKNGNVYCSGFFVGPWQIGCYWINDSINVFPGPSFTWGIDVDRSNIFVAGTGDNEYSYMTAYCWRNDNRLVLPVPFLDTVQVSEATDVFIRDSDVYVCGYYTDNTPNSPRPGRWNLCYWKNGTRTDLLPDIPQGSKRPILYVDDSCVYIATDTTAWKDTVRMPLEKNNGYKIVSIFSNTNPTSTKTKVRQNNILPFSCSIIPDPYRGVIKIIQTNKEPYFAKIFDLNGKIITSKQLTANESFINMSKVHKGIYLIKLQNKHSLKVFSTIW